MIQQPPGLMARPEVSAAVARIMSGEAFSFLLLDEKEQRAAALEAVLDKVVDEGTRVAWVGNPLRSALTIERFLIQIVGPEVDLRIERNPADLAKFITRPVGHESRLLIVVQQPETINAETRDLIGTMAAYLGGGAVQAQFLFAGSSSFTLPSVAVVKIAHTMPVPTIEEPWEPPSPRRRDVLPLLALLLVLVMGVMISMAEPSLERVPTATSTQTVIPEPAASVSPPPKPDLAALRREFDIFLAQRASTLPAMTEGQKDSLFAEFLIHRRPN